jgi:hypothetical protein
MDLTALLLEFEACHRSGRAMDSQRLDSLRRTVKEALISEYAARDGEIPVRDPVTRRITWKSRRQLRGRHDLELWENVSDSCGDWLDHLVATLDRMLTQGTQRDPTTGKRTPPRLAKQVADRLAAGLGIDEPMSLVNDCLKYAIYDEMRAAKRRMETIVGLNEGEPSEGRRPVLRTESARTADSKQRARRLAVAPIAAAAEPPRRQRIRNAGPNGSRVDTRPAASPHESKELPALAAQSTVFRLLKRIHHAKLERCLS